MKRCLEEFRILVVDDESEILDLIETYLKEEGEWAEGALNGTKALKLHEEDPYDLLIVDLNLPDISGIELMKRIRNFDEMVEFIVITGYASLQSAVEAVRLGAFDYIVKPFRLEELKVAVKNVKDKVLLKKVNRQLFKRLQSLYEEIERYGISTALDVTEDDRDIGDQRRETTRILEEIRALDTLKKGRFLID